MQNTAGSTTGDWDMTYTPGLSGQPGFPIPPPTTSYSSQSSVTAVVPGPVQWRDARVRFAKLLSELIETMPEVLLARDTELHKAYEQAVEALGWIP